MHDDREDLTLGKKHIVEDNLISTLSDQYVTSKFIKFLYCFFVNINLHYRINFKKLQSNLFKKKTSCRARIDLFLAAGKRYNE